MACKPGADIKLIQIAIKKQIKVVEPRLLQAVWQNSMSVEAVNSGLLMTAGMKSPSRNYQKADLSDYLARNVSGDVRLLFTA